MKLADVQQIPNPGSICVNGIARYQPYNVMLLRKGLDIYAYVNSCPHTGAPLDFVDGNFLSNDGEHIQCRTHDALFSINNGHCLAGPCPGQSLQAIPVEVRDGEVWLL